jgi:hypothetical protein
MKILAAVLAVILSAFAAQAQAVTSVTSPIQVNINGTGFAATDVINGPTGCTFTYQSPSLITGSCIGVVTVTGITVTNPCPTATYSATNWTTFSFSPQVSNFEIQFDITPTSALQDGVFGVGSLPATSTTSYNALAALIRTNDSGFIDARNGGGYAAVSSVPYVVNGTYHITEDISMSANTYSAYVGPAGGTRQTVALNYAFRTGAPTTPLAAFSINVDEGATTGTLKVCNFQILPYVAPSPTAYNVDLKWNASTCTNCTISGYTIYKGTSTAGPFTAVTPAPIPATTYTDPVHAGDSACYTVTATDTNNPPDVSKQATPVCAAIPVSIKRPSLLKRIVRAL